MMTVLVFGTFDIFHPGHEFFLSEAAKLGEKLTVAVARDKHVQELKNHTSVNDQKYRLQIVREQEMVDEAVLNDEVLGSFEVIEKIKPDIIAIGHDQVDLEKALGEWLKEQRREIEIVRIGHEK